MNSKDRRATPGANEPQMGGGDPPPTPLGHPVVSRYAALSERIREDWKVHGHETHLPSSAYRLQALYLDFGRSAPAGDLAASILRLLDDPRNAARSLVGDPRLLEADRRSFGDLLDEDVTLVGQRVARLGGRALVAALAFNAHFWNVRLAVRVVGEEQPLEGASLGTCAFVAERRVGRSLAGDLRYYAPVRERREAFCTNHCLPALGPRPSDDRPCRPARTPADCGMLRILEGFRFFASFPDE
ncbi:MAG TPA: hypothetical protein VLL75_19550 [Vicinamibacteria bacterium]|nr:hypothetical protein [Vicinamibacteria bacterium]